MEDLLTSYISLNSATMNKQKIEQHGVPFRRGGIPSRVVSHKY